MTRPFILAARCAVLTALCGIPSLPAQVTWSVLADHPSATTTRSLRGFALNASRTLAYGALIQGSAGAGVRRYTLAGIPAVGTDAGFFNVTTQPYASSASHQAEAVVVDDRGWVYAASIKDSTSVDNARIYICTEDLATSTMVVLADIDFVGTTGETIGGLDVRNESGTYQLYVTRFRTASDAPYVERYVVGGADVSTATLTLDPSFGVGGRYTLPGGSKLRGIDVAADGTMFIASRETDTLWRVPSTLVGETSAVVLRAMDVAVHGDFAYVSTYDGTNSAVIEIDATTLAATGRTFTATGTFGRAATEGYSGIDIDFEGHLYVSDQLYATNSDRVLVSSPICPPTAWSVVADHPSATTTRSLRGFALNASRTRAYGSFIQGSGGAGVRRYTLAGDPAVGTDTGLFNVTTQPYASSASHQAEAVVVDDRGWVYVASIKDSTSVDNARIYICTEDLATSSMVVLADIDFPGTTGETVGGLDVRNANGTYQLYATRFRTASDAPYVERYVVGGADVSTATLTLDPSFGVGGRYTLPGGSKLRGIDVAADGTMFIASRETNTLWKVPSTLIGETSAVVTSAMDVALWDQFAYVSTYAGAASAIIEVDASTLVPTGREFTAVDTFARGATEGYSGIDIDLNGRLYVCDQIYASNSDRILVSSPICPAARYVTIGGGCRGTGLTVPNLEAQPGNRPAIGSSFFVDVTGMPVGGGAYFVVLGFRSDDWAGIPLPYDCTPIDMPGCVLYTDVADVAGGLQVGGSATYSLTFPAESFLLGLNFYNQAIVADPSANSFGIVLSNCKRGLIGL